MCNAGFVTCNGGQGGTTCETNTQNDPSNCGTCGHVCVLPNATAGCTNGVCSILSCATGWADCDGIVMDGCETFVQGDPKNCGACTSLDGGVPDGGAPDGGAPDSGVPDSGVPDGGHGGSSTVCQGMQTCLNGLCSISCPTGFGDCAMTGTVCQTPLNTNQNCGACGQVCNLPNSTSQCTMTMTDPPVPLCVVAKCNPGWANCTTSLTNGCQTNTQTDPTNCGSCGNVCTTKNGTPVCNGGACGIGSCNPGWSHCNGSPGNDCDTPIGTVSNCSMCGDVCSTTNGTPACVGGHCAVGTCNAPFINCPGDGTNCATNPQTDNNNCGGCGQVCDAATCGGMMKNVSNAACMGGMCEISMCTAGWDDNDMQCADGCECQLSTVSSKCAGAFSLGSIPPLAAAVSHTSNLFPAAPNTAYYTVTFSGNTDVTNYHPRITITDPLGEFVMDVTSDCSTLISNCNTMGANETVNAMGVTTWETSYSGPNPQGDPTSKDPTGVSNFTSISPGSAGTVYVKVYRKVAVTACNNAYTITASN
jgi:hypothetical protein